MHTNATKISNEATMLVLLTTVMRVLGGVKDIINTDLDIETQQNIAASMVRDALEGTGK